MNYFLINVQPVVYQLSSGRKQVQQYINYIEKRKG
jgi:hypothetical protein